MGSRETLFALAFLAAWVVLNRWVLPRFGVPTCMSGGCAASTCPTSDREEEELTKGERR